MFADHVPLIYQKMQQSNEYERSNVDLLQLLLEINTCDLQVRSPEVLQAFLRTGEF